MKTSLKGEPKSDGKKKKPCKTCADEDEKKDADQKKIDKMTEKLSPQAKADIAKSPSMQRDLVRMHDAGWKPIESGEKAFAGWGRGMKGLNDEDFKTVSIRDPGDTLSLSHELQHSRNTMDGAYTVPGARGTMTEDQFATSYGNARVGDERSSFDRAVTTRSEILGNGGRDIGTPPVLDEANTARYRAGYESYARKLYQRLP